eukprot:NODE_436_length_2087_cov_88.380765_g349_i0.p1 GENE.NODE_436_length_2087_cov_88.380765_g349_i0~~NODE_436_length_2087_cov_88.380765_g349_i0.p1  ORF type:complete len:654 (+),score=236.05 NODE_436_length_2087_cov_88.380765_g349_i0:123-1964(+)
MDRILKAQNPNLMSTLVTFSHRKEDRCYKFVPTMDQMACHFSLDGNLLRKDSDEYRKQVEEKERLRREMALAEEAEKNPDLMAQGVSTKILKNQFNYCDRASQTFNNALRERAAMTEPPPIITFSSTATQWEIYDAYVEDLKHQQAQAQKKGGTTAGKKSEANPSSDDAPMGNEDVLKSDTFAKSLKIMERMVNQNIFNEVSDDFKYWEDAADIYKEDGGTLLPLWKFTSDRVKKKTVTALSWNPQYSDLFAVGYGSYDFLRQGGGVVNCFTLKNPSYPEYSFSTESGVMCLDWHPQHPSLLAIGLYDGSVAVYDVRAKNQKPLHQSTVKTGKHMDPVWQVFWQAPEDRPGTLSFFSVSSDGRVTCWTLAKNELQFMDVIQMKVSPASSSAESGAPSPTAEDPDVALAGLSGGTCFDFSRTNPSLFVVGTEEGQIRKCSRAYNSQYLQSYEGHFMSVYSVQWNNFHPDVFLSASADWTVKLWSQSSSRALMSFDLGAAVGEASWAPYSSSVFAAVTADGKVHIYDLNDNKHEPMCDQMVVQKAKLTRMAFNPKEPIILVGDDRGSVLSLKLSPNLRKKAKIADGKTKEEVEIGRLDKIIEVTMKDRHLMASNP